MRKNLIQEIINFLFGKKYYANIVNVVGTTQNDICSYIFKTKWEASKHRSELTKTKTFIFVETVSFRSHIDY